MAIKLTDAFSLNDTPDLTSFKSLQDQCKNTDYFTEEKPINYLSSWEGFFYYASDSGYVIETSLSTSAIAASGGSITVTYTVKQNPSNSNGSIRLVSGVTPTVTSTIGAVSNITATNSSGVGTAKITVASLGTTLQDKTTGTITTTYSGVSKTASFERAANYINTSGTVVNASFSYANIGAGATSASKTLTGSITWKYSSGSTSTSNPSVGTTTNARTYSLAEVKNGFTAVNSSGTLTATSRGTTIGTARTSGVVTSVLTYTYKYPSTVNSGATITVKGTSTATCTQAANEVTKIVAKSASTNTHAYYSTFSPAGSTLSPTTNGSNTTTYSSGATGVGTSANGFVFTRTYSSISGTGFTLNSTSIGSITAANMEKIEGSRTGSVSSTLVVSYTNPSGTVIKSEGFTQTITLTQGANVKSSAGYTGTITASKTQLAASADSATISYGAVYANYEYTSGSTSKELYSGTVSAQGLGSLASFVSSYTNSTTLKTATLNVGTLGSDIVDATCDSIYLYVEGSYVNGVQLCREANKSLTTSVTCNIYTNTHDDNLDGIFDSTLSSQTNYIVVVVTGSGGEYTSGTLPTYTTSASCIIPSTCSWVTYNSSDRTLYIANNDTSSQRSVDVVITGGVKAVATDASSNTIETTKTITITQSGIESGFVIKIPYSMTSGYDYAGSSIAFNYNGSTMFYSTFDSTKSYINGDYYYGWLVDDATTMLENISGYTKTYSVEVTNGNGNKTWSGSLTSSNTDSIINGEYVEITVS